MEELKRYLYDFYGGFADKRIKHFDNGDIFIADDRGEKDHNAFGRVYSSLCMVLVRVRGATWVNVLLRGNLPVTYELRCWAREAGAGLENGDDPCLMFPITPETLGRLGTLADVIEEVVDRDAAPYCVRSLKYACPRTAHSLRRLKSVLREFWGSRQLIPA
jgi:hypothetical protein